MGRTLRNLVDVRAKRKWKDAIIIDNWWHLKDWYDEHGPSETHRIEFDQEYYTARLIRLVPNHKWEYGYLSTHTFYGKGQWLHSTQMLYKAGFKGIIIRNWDAKEENQEWPEHTWKPKKPKYTEYEPHIGAVVSCVNCGHEGLDIDEHTNCPRCMYPIDWE